MALRLADLFLCFPSLFALPEYLHSDWRTEQLSICDTGLVTIILCSLSKLLPLFVICLQGCKSASVLNQSVCIWAGVGGVLAAARQLANATVLWMCALKCVLSVSL